MKLQFLGDSKDSFKWDYHDFLLQNLGYDHLKIAWMMTPDDGSDLGNTPAKDFPAREEIINFCIRLRDERDPKLLYELPKVTGASYQVSLHDGSINGCGYFSGFGNDNRQVVFIDPDNGFEPKNPTAQHVKFSDLRSFIDVAPKDTIVTVFQHARRKKFSVDFSEIVATLDWGYSTAIYWNGKLMFICICSSETILNQVKKINTDYAAQTNKKRRVISII